MGEVTVDGKAATWRYDGRALRVTLEPGREKARVAVAYRATPRRGLYFLEPDEHYPDAPAPGLDAVPGGGRAPLRSPATTSRTSR